MSKLSESYIMLSPLRLHSKFGENGRTANLRTRKGCAFARSGERIAYGEPARAPLGMVVPGSTLSRKIPWLQMMNSRAAFRVPKFFYASRPFRPARFCLRPVGR